MSRRKKQSGFILLILGITFLLCFCCSFALIFTPKNLTTNSKINGLMDSDIRISSPVIKNIENIEAPKAVTILPLAPPIAPVTKSDIPVPETVVVPNINPLPASPQAVPVPQPAPLSIQTPPPAPSYACNCKKTCPNMSCEEAQYQLNVCGCNARDKDKDGIACNDQCS